MCRYLAAAVVVCSLLWPSLVAAGQEESKWGVAGGFAPRWKVPSEFKLLFDAEEIDVEGAELRLGFVRGRTRSGDWGVSFVRKTLRKGSLVDRGSSRRCFAQLGCVDDRTFYVTDDVRLVGLEIHKFVPFVTIKERVQIGMNFAGGVAWLKGNAERHDLEAVLVTNPSGQVVGLTQKETITVVNGREIIVEEVDILPLVKVEVAVAAIVAPGIKVRFSGGLNLPGYHAVSITGVYLFGAR